MIRPEPETKIEWLSAYKGASAFLIDAAGTGQYGGIGVKADWEFAQTAAKSQRILLAGGLTPENVGEASTCGLTA